MRIALIQGHPDPAGGHFGHALAEAYEVAARAAGHEVRRIDVARLEFPLLRSQADWLEGAAPPALVVTMGMPAFFYRVVYRAHSVKSLERNILNFVGCAGQDHAHRHGRFEKQEGPRGTARRDVGPRPQGALSGAPSIFPTGRIGAFPLPVGASADTPASPRPITWPHKEENHVPKRERPV